MSRKRQEEVLDLLMEGKTIEALSDKIKEKILPSLEHGIKEMMKNLMLETVTKLIKDEIKPLVDKIKSITEENKTLQIRVDRLEMQLRSNDLVIHGIPESSYASVASGVTAGEGDSSKHMSRQDTMSAVVECCRTRLDLDISMKDITAGYRIPGIKNAPRPIVITLASKTVRDRIYSSRRLLHKQEDKHKIYINEHLTKRCSEIFSRGRRLLKEKKISSIWTWNGVVFAKRVESDKPIKILSLEEVEKLQTC